MKVYDYLYIKLRDQMRIISILKNKPKQKVRLDPIGPEDINISMENIIEWSEDNLELYQMVLDNGMAEFICNEPFLNQFYHHLNFHACSISQIDRGTLKLVNLKVLRLCENNIQTLENIPPFCTELYIDYNNIHDVSIPKTSLELLSISHNSIEDGSLRILAERIPEIRCLNVSFNQIEDIRSFVSTLKVVCPKLRILTSHNNPISMLSIYYKYITEELILNYFDNGKYKKPEVEKPVQPKQEKKQQKKQEKKEDKKDDKKKKGGKTEEKPPEVVEEKKQQPVPEPKILTQQDFLFSRFSLNVSNFENFSGITVDPTLFSQENPDPKKIQSTYWIQWKFMGEQGSNFDDRITFDQITNDGEENRLNFDFVLKKQLKVTSETKEMFNNGIQISVFEERPLMKPDADGGDPKPDLTEENQIKMEKKIIGGIFINTQQFHLLKEKKLQMKYFLFSGEVYTQPLFKFPFINESDLIQQNRRQFDAKLAQEEEERRKKQQEEEALKGQKKGGKDVKKADKKAGKKDSKQPVNEKKTVEKCQFPVYTKQYSYLGEKKMYKCFKESLGIKIELN